MSEPAPRASSQTVDDALAQQAQGAAVMVLAAVGAALGLGYIVHRLHGGPYIPIVIPALCGAAFGGLVGSVRVRFKVELPWAATAACALAAIVFVAAFQALIYIRSVDLVSTQVTPQGAEQLTSWWGFLTWTSTTPLGAELSPLGVLGRLSVTPVLVASVILVELLAAFAAARWAEARRTASQLLPAGPANPPAPRRREQIGGRLPTEGLLAGLHALDAGQLEQAAQHLAAETRDGEHTVYLSWTPHSAAAWLLEVMALDAAGNETLNASRPLSSWDGQQLMDEIRAARGAS